MHLSVKSQYEFYDFVLLLYILIKNSLLHYSVMWDASMPAETVTLVDSLDYPSSPVHHPINNNYSEM